LLRSVAAAMTSSRCSRSSSKRMVIVVDMAGRAWFTAWFTRHHAPVLGRQRSESGAQPPVDTSAAGRQAASASLPRRRVRPICSSMKSRSDSSWLLTL
jgi:hypothetical protein